MNFYRRTRTVTYILILSIFALFVWMMDAILHSRCAATYCAIETKEAFKCYRKVSLTKYVHDGKTKDIFVLKEYIKKDTRTTI